jgi:hypothetical protein
MQLNFFALFLFSLYPYVRLLHVRLLLRTLTLHSPYTHTNVPSPESPWRSSRNKLNNLIPVSAARNVYSFRRWPFNISYSFPSSLNWKNSQELLLFCFPYCFCLSLCSTCISSNPSHLLQCAVHRPVCKAIRIPLAMVCSFMNEHSLFGRRVKAVKGNPFPAPLLILTYALHIVCVCWCIPRYTYFYDTVCAKNGDTHNKVYFYNLMQPTSVMT